MIGHVLHSADNAARLPHLCSGDDDDEQNFDDDEQNFNDDDNDDDNAASLFNLCSSTLHYLWHDLHYGG